MAQYVNFCYQPAIYISRILPGHANVEFIIGVINDHNLGMVWNIDIKPSPSNYEDHAATLYYAIVYFKHWNIENTIDFRSTLMMGKFVKLYYNASNFWKVTAYKDKTYQQMQQQNYIMPPIQPVMQQPYPGSIMPIAPGLFGIGTMPPPPPKLQRQYCREYTDFDMFYHKLQLAEFWRKHNGEPHMEDTATTTDTYEEDDTMDDVLAQQFLNEKKINGISNFTMDIKCLISILHIRILDRFC